jgi:hypothetical protein
MKKPPIAPGDSGTFGVHRDRRANRRKEAGGGMRMAWDGMQTQRNREEDEESRGAATSRP